MSVIYIVFWFFLVVVLVYVSSNLLFSLITLEILSLFLVFFFGSLFGEMVFSEYYLLILFSLFVVEGVIGLVGFIILVFFSGSDYISSSSLMKF